MQTKSPLLEYAHSCLSGIPHASKKKEVFRFRNRYTHTLRVMRWCERLMQEIPARREVVLAAAALHDIGYAVAAKGHARHGALMARGFLLEQGYDQPFVNDVCDAIERHSDKPLPANEMSDELIVLQDADCLDELGALTVLWDSMAEGALQEQGYEKTYRRLFTSYENIVARNRELKSEPGARLYRERLEVLRGFLEQVRYELFL